MSFKLILKKLHMHTLSLPNAAHLSVGCSTTFLLPYWGAAPFPSPPSIDGYTCLDMDFVATFFRMAAFLSFRWNHFWEVIHPSLIEEAEPNELSSTFLCSVPHGDRA
jgi:hypothetical protein